MGGCGGVFAALVAGAIAWLRMAPTVPVVESVTQHTDDGEPKTGQRVIDGSRVYFNEGPNGSWKIAQVSTSGGRTSLVDTRVPSPWIAGIAPDNSSLLVSAGGYEDGLYPLWLIPFRPENRAVSGPLPEVMRRSFPTVEFCSLTTEIYAAEKDGSPDAGLNGWLYSRPQCLRRWEERDGHSIYARMGFLDAG